MNILIKIFILVTIVAVIVGAVRFAQLFSFFHSMNKYEQTKYNQSFHTRYSTNDYNDTRIRYYAKSLETYVPQFIEAKDQYDIFANDVKTELAQSCIDYLQNRHDKNNYGQGYEFYKNARNQYAKTQNKIALAQSQEQYTSRYFYVFGYNLVHEIANTVTGKRLPDKWQSSDKSPCLSGTDVETLYDAFVKNYFQRFPGSIYFDKRGQQWFKKFEQHFPKLVAQREEKKRDDKRRYEAAVREMKMEKEKQSRQQYERAVKTMPPLFAAIVSKSNSTLDDLLRTHPNLEIHNDLGQTPIFAAVVYRNTYAVKALLDAGANMYADYYDTTAFNWAVQNGERSLDSVQLFLDHGYDVNYQHNKSETALTCAAKGCRNFSMVELLLRHGADPSLIDEFGHSSMTALERYCKKGSDYKRMMELLEDYD
jgi:uncharacterized protein